MRRTTALTFFFSACSLLPAVSVAGQRCDALVGIADLETVCGAGMRAGAPMMMPEVLDEESRKCAALYLAGDNKGSFRLDVRRYSERTGRRKHERAYQSRQRKASPEGVENARQARLAYTTRVETVPAINDNAFAYDAVDDGMNITIHFVEFFDGKNLVKLRSESDATGNGEVICDRKDLVELGKRVQSRLGR